MASNATIHDALNLPDVSPLAARVLHLPITSDAEAFGRVARASERVLVRLAEPGSGQRRALASFVFDGVEAELERLGAAPRGWTDDDSLEEIARDQLYRARLLGCFGIAISFAALGALADGNGRVSPEDSETLHRLLALAEREPLQLYLPRSSAELLIAGAPQPLSAWLPQNIEPGRVATIEYDPVSEQASAASEALLFADPSAEVTLIPPPLEAFIDAPRAVDTATASQPAAFDDGPGIDDLALDAGGDRVSAGDASALEAVAPEPFAAGGLDLVLVESAPGSNEPEPPPSGELAVAREDAVLAPAPEAVPAQAVPAEAVLTDAIGAEASEMEASELAAITSVDAAALEPAAPSDLETPAPPSVGALLAEAETPAPAAVRALHQVAETPAPPSVEAPFAEWETPAPPSVETLFAGGETPAPSSVEDVLVSGETPAPPCVDAPHDVAETPAPHAVIAPEDAERLERCLAWAGQLQSMSGPKVHGSIEKAFVGAYLPLRREIAAGGVPSAAIQTADRWAEGFAQSYASAFRQLTGGARRPRMVRDIVEIGVRWLGQHHGRQCQLLLVSAMRFDLGQRLNEELERRLSGKAVCIEQTLLWAALPSNSEAQQLGEALGIGRRGRYEATPRTNGTEIESGHVGSRELFRLRQLPAELASPGEHENARLQRLATELADTLAPWIVRQPPDTLVLLFGDHGFHWESNGAGTSAAQRGGALPEQVLVPACGWLLRDTRTRAKTAPGVH